MKKMAKKITAFLAAAMMASASSGISACAEAAVIHFRYEGWVRVSGEWTYYDESNLKITDQDYEVDGIMYSFDDKGICTGKRSGLVKTDGIQRRYNDGLPYTGWTKSKDGSRKYYLDGYFVTGDHQIGKKIYSFDNNGIYTGNKKAEFTANCGKKISSDTDMFKIKITYNAKDKSEFFAYDPEVMERWENGKWVNCRDTASEFVTDDCLAVINSSRSDSVHFYPQDYTGNRFTPGYYRLKMNVSGNIFYDVFEVVPPVEIEMSEEIYLYTSNYCKVGAEVIINSEKFKDKDFSFIAYEPVYDDDGWVRWWEADDFTSWNWDMDPVDDPEPVSETGNSQKLYCYVDHTSGGCYKAVLEIDGTEYSKYFRIEKNRDQN